MRIYVSGTIVYLGWQSIPAACVSFYIGCSGHSLAQKVHFGAQGKMLKEVSGTNVHQPTSTEQ